MTKEQICAEMEAIEQRRIAFALGKIKYTDEQHQEDSTRYSELMSRLLLATGRTPRYNGVELRQTNEGWEFDFNNVTYSCSSHRAATTAIDVLIHQAGRCAQCDTPNGGEITGSTADGI